MLEKIGNHYALTRMEKFPRLRLAFSTKYFGNMSLSWGDEKKVLENRGGFIQELGLSEAHFITFWLTHSLNVAVVKDRNTGQSISDPKITFPEFDGAVTNQKRVFFLMCSADCLPIIYFDPKQEVIGIAHAGWKGLMGAVHLNILKIMTDEFRSDLGNIRIGLGPSIGSCCNLQKIPLVQDNLPQWRNYLKRKNDDFYRVFLNEFCRDSLIDYGIARENIEEANFCTVDNYKEFFSETAVQGGLDKDPMGRFCTVVGMV